MNDEHLHQANLIGLPTRYFASPAFNSAPLPVAINGVREKSRGMFSDLDQHGAEEASALFIEHMRVMFDLPESGAKEKGSAYRAHYLRLIRGWRFDSNRPEGAVMKGWAESRFGLRPLFHGGPIGSVNDPAYYTYLQERMSPRFHNNAIFSQLDLLYEFCQYWLGRFGPEEGTIPLYRGSNGIGEENQLVEKREKRLWVVRNNSLVSYTADRERADEFGDTVLMIEAPFAKIVCFPDLVEGGLPKSEAEYLTLGGDYLSEVVAS